MPPLMTADFPNKRIARFKVPIVENGARAWCDMSEVDSSSAGAHRNWPDGFFARIVDAYLSEINNAGGRVGQADAYLIDSPGLVEFATRTMKVVASD